MKAWTRSSDNIPLSNDAMPIAMAKNLADALGVPLKINEGGDQARPIEASDFPTSG
jgi:hypothetical protein